MVTRIDLSVFVKNNLSQKARFGALALAAVFVLLAVFGNFAPAAAAVLPLPAPTLLRPAEGAILGQDKAWVGGVVKNNLLVKVLVDGKEVGQVKARSHSSGTVSFGLKLSSLSLGEHTVVALAQDKKGKISPESNVLTILVKASTPTPTLGRPAVNSNSGIERPFIIGNIQNGLSVGIIIDGKIQTTLTPEPSASGVTSFAWQPEKRLSLGKHLIEAFASDNGKLSNHDQIFWQVGEVKTSQAPEPEKDVSTATPVVDGVGGTEPTEPSVKVTENKDEAQKLTVRQELESTETPVIPDAAKEEPKTETATPVESADDSQGKIESSGTEPETKVSQAEPVEPVQGEVTEVSPGAVVRATADDAGSGFKLNNSLIVGITILIFLLLSLAVWYIQERRDKLGEKVVGIFREDEDIEKPINSSDSKKDYPDYPDLPPPPPPMF